MVNKNGAREPFLLTMTMNRSGVAREMMCALSPQRHWVTRSGTGRAAAHLRIGRQ